MTKIQRSEIRIEHNDGDVIEYVAEELPRETELGNYFLAKLHARGIAKLQQAGHDITTTDGFVALVSEKLGLDAESDFGSLGKWKTDAEREASSVYINGTIWNGEELDHLRVAVSSAAKAQAVADKQAFKMVKSMLKLADEATVFATVSGILGEAKARTLIADVKSGA